MVVVKVIVHPNGLGPKEAGKAWYSALLPTMLLYVYSHFIISTDVLLL